MTEEELREWLSTKDKKAQAELRKNPKVATIIEQIKAERGYQGLVVVCAVYFTAIAGHIPDRPAIKYLVAQRDMEIWFAPLAGTRMVVPFRISIPTPLGLGVMQATQFVSTPQSARATPTNVRVQ